MSAEGWLRVTESEGIFLFASAGREALVFRTDSEGSLIEISKKNRWAIELLAERRGIAVEMADNALRIALDAQSAEPTVGAIVTFDGLRDEYLIVEDFGETVQVRSLGRPFYQLRAEIASAKDPAVAAAAPTSTAAAGQPDIQAIPAVELDG